MPRQRFKIHGEHARVRSLKPEEQRKIGFRPEPLIVRRKSRKPLSPVYSAAMLLAHMLYPENFPEIAATSAKRKHHMTYSVFAPTDAQSRKATKSFYRRHFWNNLLGFSITGRKVFSDSKAYRAHDQRILEFAQKTADKILDESGFEARFNGMNIGFSPEGKPVFFEVSKVVPKLLRKKIESMPEGLGKKQALALLEEIEKEALRTGNFHGVLEVHD